MILKFCVLTIFYLQGSNQWVKCRAEREELAPGQFVKTVSVDNNPFGTLVLRPWLEDKTLGTWGSTDGFTEEENPPEGHFGITYTDKAAAEIDLYLSNTS